MRCYVTCFLTDPNIAPEVPSISQQILQLVSAAGVDTRDQRPPKTAEDQKLAWTSHVCGAAGPDRHETSKLIVRPCPLI